jgi:hypothetical protein
MKSPVSQTVKKVKYICSMKSAKPILLIFLVAIFFVSCENKEIEETSSREMVEKKQAEKDAAKKAEEAKENSINYLESVDVDDVNYVWQKNLFWFFCRNLSQ